MSLWWLSFADGKLPEGSQFLGACVVSGDSIISAVQGAHMARINPGGEVQGLELPPEADALVGSEWRWRLLNRAECAEFDREIERKRATRARPAGGEDE